MLWNISLLCFRSFTLQVTIHIQGGILSNSKAINHCYNFNTNSHVFSSSMMRLLEKMFTCISMEPEAFFSKVTAWVWVIPSVDVPQIDRILSPTCNRQRVSHLLHQPHRVALLRPEQSFPTFHVRDAPSPPARETQWRKPLCSIRASTCNSPDNLPTMTEFHGIKARRRQSQKSTLPFFWVGDDFLIKE